MKRHQSRSAIQLFILLFLFISPQLVAQTNKLERNSTVQSLFNYKTFHAIKSIEPLSQDRLKTTDRILLSSNSKFEIWGLESEQAAADTVIKVLTANYDRIADSLNTQLTNYVTVDIYPDLSTFHAAINWPSAPDWAVGAAFGETNIHMVSPYNPGPVHSFSSIINVVTHELVHCFVHNLKNGASVPIWINEGSASYLAFQATSTNQICDYIDQHGSIPTLSELNNGSTYGNIGGYSFGYSIVEFIVTEVGGSDILSQFIASGANYSILGFANETEFQIAWQQFLGDQYPCYVNDPITSIYDIQYTTIAGDGTYPSLLLDQLVTTHGIVTAINYDGNGNNFFISSQEAGPWKGIYVYNADTSPLIGDEVQLNGTIIEFYGITEIHSPTVTILTSGNTVPEPVIANTGNLINSVNAEAYEGCLIKVENITVTQNEDNLNQWYVDDGSGACQIDDKIFRYTDISLGKQYQYIIGALDYSFSEYGINPRFLSDVLVKEEQSFVEPLIQNQWTTFTWPYNAYMPEDSEGINGHVGNACGYTSIARILHYWEFPNNGIGNLQFTDTWGFSWDCDLENLNLDYSKMPNYLPFDATQAEYDETAKLFEAAGAVGEKIKVWATGFEIYLPAAFIDYFKFSSNATIVNRENYTKQEWIDIFKNELDNGRPMVIVGRTPDSPAPDEPGQITGHWWICDGYNSAGEFYVDYAFGGIKGYWDIDNLGEVYTAYNRAVIGLQPNTDIKTLELSFPNGGETIFANTEVDITWNSINISDIKIEFSEDNGSNWEEIIASTDAATQSFNVTTSDIFSDQCLIRITDVNDETIFDVSESTFTIDNTNSTGELDQELILKKISALNLHKMKHEGSPFDVSIEVLSASTYQAQKPIDALSFDVGYVDASGKVFVCEPTSSAQLAVFDDITQAAIYYVCQSFLQYYYQSTEMPLWFKCGFAAYESDMRIYDADIETAYNNYGGTLTSFDVLNNPISFEANNGFAISYLFGEFVAVFKSWSYNMIQEVNASTIIPYSNWYNAATIEDLFDYLLRYLNARIFEGNEQNRLKLGNETEHFKYYYRGAENFWAVEFPVILEEAITEYKGLLDFDVFEKFSFLTMPICNYVTIGGGECVNLRYTSGTAWSSGLWASSPDNANDFDRFRRLIRHELAHLVQQHLPVGNMTAWLNEGFAQFMGKGPYSQEDIDGLQSQTEDQINKAINYFGHLPTYEDTKVYPGQSNVDYYLLGEIMLNFIYVNGGYPTIKDVMINHETGIANMGFSSVEDFMAAYYQYVNINYLKIEQPYYFTDYDAFITKLNNLTSSTDSSAKLNTFWNNLIATGNFPFAIDTKVAFLYRGSSSSINWAGMFNGWGANTDAGTRLGVSDIWIFEKEFPKDTRCEYKIVRNGGEWLADPNNPHPLVGDYENSELWMPDYKTHTELIPRSGIAKGSLSNNVLKNSTNLGYTSQYRVYTPADYNNLSNLPTIYVTDGQNYLDDNVGKMVIVLDNLIADEIIKPVIAIFLDPRDPNNLFNDRRGNEYRNNIGFVNYVTQELIPDIDANYNTNASADARSIMGTSYGGYNAAYFCIKAPDFFHHIGMNSPYLHPNGNYSIDSDLQAANLDEMKLYLSYGTFDADGERYFNRIKDILDQKGKAFESTIIGDGHTWQNWSRVIGDALKYFFPLSETVSLSLISPNGGENYLPGSSINISWNSTLVSDVKIEFSENNGSNWEDIIASTSANTQSYNWTAPEITSSQCLIKISDPTDAGLFDVSETTFTIDNTQTFISPYTPDENTVLLMHLDGDLTNSSTLSGDGTQQGGGISYSTGAFLNFDQCLDLDGSSYITIPHNENLNLTGDWTIEAWINITEFNPNTQSVIVRKPGDTDNYLSNYAMEVHPWWGNVLHAFYFSAEDTRINVIDMSPNLNQWYHIAFIRDTENNEIRLTIRDNNWDIVSSNSKSYSGNEVLLNSQDLRVGEGLIGYIDELRISNVVRSFETTIDKQEVTSENLKIYYDPENSDAANTILSQLQPKIDFYKKYFKYFFTDHSKIFSINICKDLTEFDQLKPVDLPDFETSYINNEILYLITPTTQVQQGYFDSFEQAAMHGFAMRCIDYLYNNNAAEWMKYGFARHQAGMKSTPEQIRTEVSNLGRKPTYQEMYNWEESATFDKYAFAYTMIQYIADVHSLDYLMGFIRFNNNSTTFGFRLFNTEESFNTAWHLDLDVFYLRETNLMKFQRESDHFYLYMIDEDAAEIDQWESELEAHYTRFTNDMQMAIGHKIHILFYPDFCDYQLLQGYDQCDPNSYSVGEALGISMCKFTRKDNGTPMMNSMSLAQHELTHVIHGNLGFDSNPRWLVEGLASLVPGGLITEDVMNGTIGVFKEQVNVGFSELIAATGKYPTILELDSDEFINENGLDHNLVFYLLGSVIVDYTIKTSGYLALKDFIQSDGLDYTTLGFADSDDFTDSFYAYFEANWKNISSQATADKTSETITIDGIINEADWELNHEVSGIYPFYQSWKNNEVKFGVLWDDNYLYVAVEVLDNVLINNSTFDWSDGVVVYIDGDFNKGIHYDTFDRQFIKRWNNTALEEKNNHIEGVLHAVQNIDGGYAVELAIPWSNLGITQVANTTIGFDISNLDEDCSETYNCRYQLIWSGNNYNPDITINFGELTLVSTLVPNFTVDITTGFNPLTVNFTDLSTGNPTTWEWDFNNDGTIDSYFKNPEWTFNNPGTYTVSLTIGDGVNTETKSKSDYISVNAPLEPEADFTSNYTSGLAPLSVDFTDQTTQGTGTLTQWNWDFGDGTSSTVQNPSHTFSEAGVYTVSLTVQDNYGLSDTKIKTNFITVYILPEEPSIPQPENQATDVSIDTDLSWTIDSNTENIDLYFGTENPPTTKVLDNVAAITTYSLTSLDYQTSYFWKIVCRSSFGSTEGPIWEFTTDIATGISDNPSDDKLISIYPNPASEKILISVPVLVDLSILDIYGKIVYEIKDFQQGEINISVFNKGIYFVVFTSKKGRVSRKIIIE